MGEGARGLIRAAGRLRPLARPGKPIPRLFFFTDPERTPDPLWILPALPRGGAVVFRAFGAPDALQTALSLRRATRARGLLLLVGEDEALAAAAAADGLHLPERAAHRVRRIRARRPGWIITAAAHSEAAVARAGRQGADAAVLSAVFPSRSASAGAPLGPVRAASLVRRARLPVVALGGVDGRTAARLQDSGAAGLAAVEAWLA